MARELISAFTIDGPTSLDLDDAIGVEKTAGGCVVHISIADVAHFVARGSSRDRRARERAFTRYLADNRNKPMLPRVLSEGEGSLLPGEPRPALTISIPLDERLVAGTPTFRRTFVRNTHKLSYPQADAIARQPDHPLHRELALCEKLARGLLEARSAAGAFALYDLERGLAIAEDGRLRPLDASRRHVSCLIIQEFMVLANATVARYLGERGLPALYRNHKALATAPPRASLLVDLRHSLLDPTHFPPATLDEKLSLVLGRASYGPRIEGHYALNLPAYVHFTSPLRRYADLVCHRVLLAALEGAESPYSIEELDKIAAHINATQDEVRDARRVSLRERAMKAEEEAGTTRALVRSVEALPDAREQMLLARVRRGEVEAVDLYRILFARWRKGAAASERLCRAALGMLRDRAEMAVSVLQMAHQDLHWPLPVTTVKQDGPAHAPSFVAATTLDAPHRRVAASGRHATKKASGQLAAVALLAALLDMGEEAAGVVPDALPPAADGSPAAVAAAASLVPAAAAASPAAVAADGSSAEAAAASLGTAPAAAAAASPAAAAADGSSAPAAAASLGTAPAAAASLGTAPAAAASLVPSAVSGGASARPADSANAKGRLLERCQARGWSMPTFTMTQSGPPHAPVFTVVAELAVGTQRFRSQPAVGPNRKAAEQAACADLLQTPGLWAQAPPASGAGVSPDDNPVGWLQEVCHKSGVALPIYADRAVPGGFEVTCCLTRGDGVRIETRVTATRKADARRAAAAQAAARWRA